MTKVPFTKPALTYAEQLQRLKLRGLIFINEPKVLYLLEKISYYRLSGYLYPMIAEPKADHIFKPGSTFNNGFKLYCFDRELRKLILGEIEKIEVSIRAIMIYILSHRHGPFWYSNPTIFKKRVTFESTLEKIDSEYSRSDEIFIMEFKNKYTDHRPPSWMMLEIISFGTLSMLYQNLNSPHDKRDIAHYFGLDDSTFTSWLHSIVYVRNVCAHHSRLWSRIMRISANIPLSPAYTWISITTVPSAIAGERPVKINNRTYYLLSMIIYLLNTINPKHTLKNKLYKLLKNYRMVDVRAMGFPDGWKSEPIWDWQKVITDERCINIVFVKFKRTIKNFTTKVKSIYRILITTWKTRVY